MIAGKHTVKRSIPRKMYNIVRKIANSPPRINDKAARPIIATQNNVKKRHSIIISERVNVSGTESSKSGPCFFSDWKNPAYHLFI